MNQFNLKNKDKKEIEIYTLNKLVPKLENDMEYGNYLYQIYDDKNYTEMNKYVDNFVDYIFDIIDEANRFIVICHSKKILKTFFNALKSDLLYYIDNDLDYDMRKVYYDLFHIDDQKSKNILKENLFFNIGDEEWEPTLVNVNNKHVSNEGLVERDSILYLVKDDNLLITFCLDNCHILDYRDKEVIKKHQELYKKKNNN